MVSIPVPVPSTPTPSTPSSTTVNARSECGGSSASSGAGTNYSTVSLGLNLSTSDLVLDNTATVLSALRHIGASTCVPFLNEAATVALRLVSLIKDVRDNNDAFRVLGLDAGKLVWTISTECDALAKTGEAVPQNVQEHIRTLVTNLREIEAFIEDKMRRKALKKFISHSADKQEVARYRQVLHNALAAFSVQANIASQATLHAVRQSVDQQKVDAVFARIHQTDMMNQLFQQQTDQIQSLHASISATRYTDEEREYHARVEWEQNAAQAAAAAEEERMKKKKRKDAEEERARKEQEAAEAVAALLLRKKAAERLAEMDRQRDREWDEAEAERKAALRQRREQERREQEAEEREMREAIAVVNMQERKEAEARRRRREQQEQEEQEEREAEERRRRRKERQRREEEEEEEEARRRVRKAHKQRRVDSDDDDEPPRRAQSSSSASHAGAHITSTKVEVTLTRKKDGKTTATKKVRRDPSFDAEAFERELAREFEGFEDEFLPSDGDEQEYWSDDAPRKRRAKGKKSVKAAERVARARSYAGVDDLRAGIQGMTMNHVNAYAGSYSPYYPPPRYGSPYPGPPPASYRYDYGPGYVETSSANATSISITNVGNSAISFGDAPAVVKNSGNVRVVNITNVGNRY